MKIKAMLRALQKIKSEDEAQALYQCALTRMDAINAERDRYQKKVLEKHFRENILPILALYLELKKSQREDALELSEKVANEMYGIGRKRMEFLGRFPFFYWIIEKLTPAMMKNAFPAEGWDID